MDISAFSSAESLIDRVISTWRAGARPDAAEVLARHPDLRARQSIMLDLAYEEYCLRKEAGESLSPEAFCDRFPSCRRSLARLLAVHDCVEDDATLAESLACEPVAWPDVGTEFQGFQILRELGRGAFARVYLATQPALGDRLVVVKVALYGGAEAETLGRLTHRNIVPVYSVSEDPATHVTAVCMPYLGHATLLDVLDVGFGQGRPPEEARIITQTAQEEAILASIPETYATPDPVLQRGTYIDGVVHLGAQLAEALEHTHQAGICHRDLKPSNVLLTPSGCPMLLDFNLSADVQLERQFVGGTLPYMSPEQLRSMTLDDAVQDAESDPRTDLFSLGVILYELLSGSLPFGDRPPDASPREAAAELLARQERGCRPVHRQNRHVNRRLARLIHHCLALDPGQRPDSAQTLAALLRRQLTVDSRLVRWTGRRRFLIFGAGLSLTLLGGIATAHMARCVPRLDLEYDAGVRAFQRGDFTAAVAHFTRAHDCAPDIYQPLIGRAQALVALGDYTTAILDLESACQLHSQGWTLAWLGYGHDCAGVSLQADHCYELASAEYDYETAATWNNRGYNALRRGAIQSALTCLSRAVELDPACQTAYRNRAVAYARSVRSPGDSTASEGQLALQDIDRALRSGPAYGELLLDAALLHWQYDQTATRKEYVVQLATRAMELGIDRPRVLQILPDLDPTLLDARAEIPATTTGLSTHSPRLPMPNRFPPLGIS